MRPSARAIVRVADTDDAGDIALVLLRAFEEHVTKYTACAFRATTPNRTEVLHRMREGPIWMARLGGVAAGTASVVCPHDGECHLRGMAVVPAARRCGVGTALLATVESYARGLGCHLLSLRTTPFLHEAIALYRFSGFAFVHGTTLDLFGTPLLKMEKRLSGSPIDPLRPQSIR